MKYKGYYIQLVPKRTEGLWQLELQRGEHITAISVGTEMTLLAIEKIALDTIDKLVEHEKQT